MVDISFKNRTETKPVILSAVIGADSFFYGFFNGKHTLLECNLIQNPNYSSDEFLTQVKTELGDLEGLKVRVAYKDKPYLHSPSDEDGSLTNFFPAYGNKHNKRDSFTAQEVVVDYGIKKSEKKFIENLFGNNLKSFHLSTVLANYYYPYTNQKLVAFVDTNKIHLLYANKQEFIYYNQFDCVDEKDYLYFTLLAYKALELDPNLVPLAISGKVDIKSPLYQGLNDYVRNVDIKQSDIIGIGDFRFKASPHYYLDLIATSQCE